MHILHNRIAYLCSRRWWSILASFMVGMKVFMRGTCCDFKKIKSEEKHKYWKFQISLSPLFRKGMCNYSPEKGQGEILNPIARVG